MSKPLTEVEKQEIAFIVERILARPAGLFEHDKVYMRELIAELIKRAEA